MNYFNCQNNIQYEEIRGYIKFWTKNTFQHIEALLNSSKGTTAILKDEFIKELNELYISFTKIYELYSDEKNKNLSERPIFFFRENNRFINLLERLKFEGYNGYSELLLSIFHYIYEQRYINAVFSVNYPQSPVLISLKFLNIGNYTHNCIYNQMYFWSLIGAMHPALIMNVPEFYNSATTYTKEFLTETTNNFNTINYSLSALKRPYKKEDFQKIFNNFDNINCKFLDFLKLLKNNSSKIYINPTETRLSKGYYQKIQHIIDEHTLVKEINKGISDKIIK